MGYRSGPRQRNDAFMRMCVPEIYEATASARCRHAVLSSLSLSLLFKAFLKEKRKKSVREKPACKPEGHARENAYMTRIIVLVTPIKKIKIIRDPCFLSLYGLHFIWAPVVALIAI